MKKIRQCVLVKSCLNCEILYIPTLLQGETKTADFRPLTSSDYFTNLFSASPCKT